MASEVEIERLMVRLMGDASSYLSELEKAKNQTTSKLANISKSLKSVSASMSSMGRSMSLRVTAPIVAGIAGSVHAFAGFDQAMTESTSIMKVTEDQTKRMRDTAISLSKQGAQSPRELAESYYFLASAGYDAERSMAALPKIMEFATAGAFDMATATDLLTDAQSALGMSSKDAAENTANMIKLSDALVGANTLANASVSQFSTALTTKAGAAFKAYNISLEEGMGLLAGFADQGIKAELAGNAVDRVIRLLTQAVAQDAAAFEKHNVAVFDAAGEFRPFKDIIGDIERAVKGMSTEMKAATLVELGFEARIQSVILPLLGASDSIGTYVDAMKDMQGITSEVAQKQMQSFTNQLKMMRNNLLAAGIVIGTKLAPMIEWLGKQVSSLATWISNLSDTTIKWATYIALAVAAIGPLLMILGPMVGVVASLVTAYSTLTVSIGTAGMAALGAKLAFAGTAIGLYALAAAATYAGITIGQWAAGLYYGDNEQLERAEQSLIDINKQQAEMDAKLEQRKMEKNVKEATEALKDSMAEITTATDGVVSNTQETQTAIDKLTESLKLQSETLGMTSEAASIYELKTKGATDAMLEQANAALKNLEAKREEKKMLEDAAKIQEDGVKHMQQVEEQLMGRGKSVIEEFMTPLEIYERKIKDLEGLLGAGAIDQTTFSRATAGAQSDLNKAGNVGEMASGGARAAVSASSAEGQSRIAEYRARVSGVSTENRQEKFLAAIEGNTSRQTELLEQIAANRFAEGVLENI